uniref:hypothetical protein n=1 Tax=Serratia entomophila TaxID=42906 RepID=UPI001F4BDB19|nr:hypothetical protein [Serratia entomophila]
MAKGIHQKGPGFCLAASANDRTSGRAVKAAPAISRLQALGALVPAGSTPVGTNRAAKTDRKGAMPPSP